MSSCHLCEISNSTIQICCWPKHSFSGNQSIVPHQKRNFINDRNESSFAIIICSGVLRKTYQKCNNSYGILIFLIQICHSRFNNMLCNQTMIFSSFFFTLSLVPQFLNIVLNSSHIPFGVFSDCDPPVLEGSHY